MLGRKRFSEDQQRNIEQLAKKLNSIRDGCRSRWDEFNSQTQRAILILHEYWRAERTWDRDDGTLEFLGQRVQAYRQYLTECSTQVKSLSPPEWYPETFRRDYDFFLNTLLESQLKYMQSIEVESESC